MKGDDHLIMTRIEELQFASQFDGALLYKTNAFRLLQLSVTATDREITRRKQAFEISIKTQAPFPDGPCRIFPLDLSSDHIDFNQIVESLRDPVHRFYQEFFWFWPLSDNKPNDDLALLSLMNGDSFQALEIWEKQNSDPKAKAVGLHNLAVFNHFAALSGLSNKNGDDTEYYWESSYQKWKNLATLSDFWSLLENRVREVDDPRLTLNHVKNLRQAVYTIISLTNAKEATRLAENGNLEGAQALLVPFVKTLGENDGGLDILKLATFTNRERLRVASSLAEDKAKNDPAHADTAAEALLAEGGKQLNVISTILPKNETSIISIREDLLEHAIQSIDAYFEKTDGWEKAMELVKKAKPFAFQAKEKEEIQKRLKGLQEFGSNQNYWHCKGYFNNELPLNLFAKLEEAKEAYDRQDFETSIRILETSLITFNNTPDISRRAIHPPLALTLNRKSRELITKGMEHFESPRPILQRIFQNIRTKSDRCIMSLIALQRNTLEYSARYNQLFCMSCESVISGQYFIGESNDIKFIICPSCNYKDNLDRKSIKDQALPNLNQAKDLLQKANVLQPKNKVVAKDLEFLKDIFQNIFQISISGPIQEKGSKAPSPPKPPSAKSSNGNKPKKSNVGWIIFITLLIFSCLIGFFALNKNSNGSSSTRSSPTAIPILNSPTTRPTSVILINTPTPSCQNWSSITPSDKGKIVCVKGTIQNAYWNNNNTIYYLTFSDEANSLRLFMEDGYYIKNVVNGCRIIEGRVVVYDGVPMIKIEPGENGKTSNFYICQ